MDSKQRPQQVKQRQRWWIVANNGEGSSSRRDVNGSDDDAANGHRGIKDEAAAERNGELARFADWHED